MNSSKKYRFWITFSLILLSQLLYWFWIRNYTVDYFDTATNSSNWFSNLVEDIYPRLKTEKYRFDASFFIKKSDQIAIRFLFVSSVFSLLLIPKFYQKTKLFFIKNSVYSQKITRKSQYFLIIYFLISNVLLSNEWLEILTEYAQIAVLYEPISFYKFLSPSFPSRSFLKNSFIFLKVITGIGISFCLLALFFRNQILFKIVLFLCVVLSSVLFIYLQGFLYGFGKIEHTYATWNWVCILLPFWVYNGRWSLMGTTAKLISQNYLLFLAIGLIYTSSGLEKIFIGGWEWINGNALLSYLQNSPTDLGQHLSNYPLLITFLSILTILWETSFLLILHKNKYIRLTLIFVGICFHVGVYFSLHVGHYFSPWIWVYVFLLPNFEEKKFRITENEEFEEKYNYKFLF
ncbi:hypothetical protein ACE193_11360 [Bernardetia sp. OM2101]|uniref:hypothetical protein n=1 Tax=Bernardetia sp. OM2101 TaxID=3344876 RepID=UPI0035CFB0D6